jgi:predicted nucleotidyltransferase
MNYRASIKEIARTLRDKYKPEKIILFGSCVAGRVTKNSDIDMLIIKDTASPYVSRWLEVGRLVRDINKPLPFEPFILTPAELKREVKYNLFLREILSTGKVLYEEN